MKINFFEGKYGSSIDLEPETLEEASALGRFVINAKAEKPQIRLYFNEKGQACSVWIKSVNSSVRKTSLSNSK